jgi:hypothetical protein
MSEVIRAVMIWWHRHQAQRAGRAERMANALDQALSHANGVSHEKCGAQVDADRAKAQRIRHEIALRELGVEP